MEIYVDDERRSDAKYIVASLRVAAATGRLLSSLLLDLFLNKPSSKVPCIRPVGARNAAHEGCSDKLWRFHSHCCEKERLWQRARRVSFV